MTDCDFYRTSFIPQAYADISNNCNLIYYNPNFKFPENFADCQKNYRLNASHESEFSCGISISSTESYNVKVYSTSIAKSLINSCKKENGNSSNENSCELLFFSENAYIPDSPEDCDKLGGKKITKEKIDYNKAIYPCQLIYNSQNHEQFYNLCVQKSPHRIVSGENQSKFCIHEFDFEGEYFNIESIL